MDIRRVQPGFAAALAHPLRLRPYETHAGAAGVEVHFPVGGEEALDIAFGEILRRTVGAVDHANFAHHRQGAAQLGGQRGAGRRVGQRCQMQHIAGTQGAAAVAAELAQGKGALAAQILRHLQTAAHAQIRPRTGAGNGADRQGAAGRDEQRSAHRLRHVIQLQRYFRAGHRHHCVGVEAQDRPAHGDFQPGGVFGVAEQGIAHTQGAAVHRAGRRNAYRPVSQAAGEVLHGGLGAGADDLEGIGLVAETFETAGPGVAAGERGKGKDLAQVIAVGFHAVEQGVAERLVKRLASLLAARRPGDDLSDHRVEIRRDLAASLDPGIDAQGLAAGCREARGGEQTGARLEIPARIFGIDARLDRMPAGLQHPGQLRQRRQVAGGQLDHPVHQIDTPDLLGDAVLDLQAGVHLEEVEALGLGVVDELDGAGAAVVDGLGQRDSRFAQCLGHAGRQVRCRSFLQHLLVASLHRAVAHAEGDDVAGTIAEHLHFQMAGALDVFLDEYARIAEVVLPQALDRVEGLGEFRRRAAHAHADTATAGGAFQHHRVADLLGCAEGIGKAVEQVSALQHRYAALFGQGAGGVLEAKHPQLFWRRADKGDAGGFTGFGKGGVLGEKAVAGVNGFRAGFPGNAENLLHHQIGLRCRAFAQAVGLVGLLDMQAGGVGLGVDGHAFHIQGAQRTQDAAGNGAAVGDQKFVEHVQKPSKGWRAVPPLFICATAVRGWGGLLRCRQLGPLPGARLQQRQQVAS